MICSDLIANLIWFDLILQSPMTYWGSSSLSWLIGSYLIILFKIQHQNTAKKISPSLLLSLLCIPAGLWDLRQLWCFIPPPYTSNMHVFASENFAGIVTLLMFQELTWIRNAFISSDLNGFVCFSEKSTQIRMMSKSLHYCDIID